MSDHKPCARHMNSLELSHRRCRAGKPLPAGALDFGYILQDGLACLTHSQLYRVEGVWTFRQAAARAGQGCIWLVRW